ncbi:MAG: HIT family protein [Pseudomonadota bacterium]
MTAAFALDPQLAADTIHVANWPLSEARLMDDASYPWVILIPRRADVFELIDLSEADHALLSREIRLLSQILADLTGCDKLNVAALGNQVRQLHVHVIARFTSDAAWPGPIWGAAPRAPYAPADRDAFIAQLKDRMVSAAPAAAPAQDRQD